MSASKTVRRAIQRSTESVRILAARYHLNPKTVQKWRHRASVEDLTRGAKPGALKLLSAEQEAIAVALRQRTLLPLDDCLYTLQATMPQLTRSALYRCFQRYGVARLTEPLRRMPRYTPGALGHILIDRHEIRTSEGRFYLFQAMDRTSKLVFAAFYESGDSRAAVRFLRAVMRGMPYQIQTVATDAGFSSTAFAALCAQHDIAHRLRAGAQFLSPDQQTRMRAVLDAASAAYERAASKRDVEARMQRFLATFNFARRLKSLGGLTPFAFTRRAFQKTPHAFRADPYHHILQLNANFGRPPAPL